MKANAIHSLERLYSLRIKWIVLGIVLILSTKLVASAELTGKANDFMDVLIQKIKTDATAVYSLDPLTVPNVETSNFQTTDLVVKGLSKLYREGNCSVSFPKDETTYATCAMAAENLIVDFKYWAKALFIWFKGDGLIRVDKLLIQLVTSFRNDNTTLKELNIVELGEIHVEKMTGLSVLLNWMLRLIAQNVFVKSRDSIRDALRKTATESLRIIMKDKNPIAL